MMLEVEVKELPAAAVAYLSGEADGRSSTELLRGLVDILETRPPRLVVVLDRLSYIDSRGLGALVGVYHRAKEQDCGFCVVSSDPQMRRVMEITGLDKVMLLCDSEEAALRENG